MRISVGVAAIVFLSALTAVTNAADEFEVPGWAYPATEEGRGRGPDNGTLLSTPDSNVQFTKTQINNPFSPPDWYPGEHPPMPEVVAYGRPPLVRACSQCHMPHGLGHPESSSLAGLPVNYAIQQMHDYESGARTSLLPGRVNSMLQMAPDMTEEELRSAAEYFSQLEPAKWITVIETIWCQRPLLVRAQCGTLNPGAAWSRLANGLSRFPKIPISPNFVIHTAALLPYVPPGSVEAGRELATTGGGRTIQCSICHVQISGGLAMFPVSPDDRRFTWHGSSGISNTVLGRAPLLL